MNDSGAIAEGILKAVGSLLLGAAIFMLVFRFPVLSIAGFIVISVVGGIAYAAYDIYRKLPWFVRLALMGGLGWICWMYGDKPAPNYNLFLVILGWVFMLFGWWAWDTRHLHRQ